MDDEFLEDLSKQIEEEIMKELSEYTDLGPMDYESRAEIIDNISDTIKTFITKYCLDRGLIGCIDILDQLSLLISRYIRDDPLRIVLDIRFNNSFRKIWVPEKTLEAGCIDSFSSNGNAEVTVTIKRGNVEEKKIELGLKGIVFLEGGRVVEIYPYRIAVKK